MPGQVFIRRPEIGMTIGVRRMVTSVNGRRVRIASSPALTGVEFRPWATRNISFTPLADHCYEVDTSAGPVDINLPEGITGQFRFMVRDKKGTFGTNNCTLVLPDDSLAFAGLDAGVALELDYPHQGSGFLFVVDPVAGLISW